MGVATPKVMLSARAAESLTQLRSILGDKVSVDLLLDAADKRTGSLQLQYESVEQAEERLSETKEALKKVGFKVKGEIPIYTRKL